MMLLSDHSRSYMQSAIRQLHAAKEAAQKAVAEVNQLQEELAESLPTTEADRQQAVEKLDRLYVYAIERLHEERCAALCTRRRLEAIGKEPESRPASPASGSVRPPYPASSTSTASSSEQVSRTSFDGDDDDEFAIDEVDKDDDDADKDGEWDSYEL
mmetsp:Transcript_19218/g.41499  ORF Transcript_19218/g.41499 Transcript_19218/m.41499 type:complete len:157 (-) Transcript_19218:265-735(-)